MLAFATPVKLAEPPDIVIPEPLVQLLSVAKSPFVICSLPKPGTGLTLSILPFS